MLYGYRPHRGSLQDSLKLTIYISKEEFYRMLDYDTTYEFYAYDNRCNQLLFLNNDYVWLFIELTNKELYRVGDLLK